MWMRRKAATAIGAHRRAAQGPHFAMGKNAHESDRRVGERMAADEVRWLGEKARELLSDYERLKLPHTLRTFLNVERLWESVIQPALPKFLMMQDQWEGQPSIPADSRWQENRGIQRNQRVNRSDD
jgi:creatinine amidohydrolase